MTDHELRAADLPGTTPPLAEGMQARALLHGIFGAQALSKARSRGDQLYGVNTPRD